MKTVKLSGADQDFHRRDMFEAIEAGNFPEWDFAVQLFTAVEAETKLHSFRPQRPGRQWDRETHVRILA